MGAPLYVVQPDPVRGGTMIDLVRGQAALAPFTPPTLARFEFLRVLLLIVRTAMTVWAFTLGAVADGVVGPRAGPYRLQSPVRRPG